MSPPHREEVVMFVDGTFDPMAASALRRRLREARTAHTVVLDFSRARDVYDLGLALVVHGVASDGIAVRFRGLSAHHAKMLRYLGLDAATTAAGP